MSTLIKSLDDLLARCDEVGECWEWRGKLSPGGAPMCEFERKWTTAMRVSYLLHHGLARSDLAGLVVWQGCETSTCVAPSHMKCGSRPQMQVWRGKQGRCKKSAQAKASHCAAKRAGSVLFTPADIASIRTASTSDQDEAAARNCSSSHIRRIRRGLVYRSVVRGASIFSMGLP